MESSRKSLIGYLFLLFLTVSFFVAVHPDNLPVIFMLVPFILIFFVLYTGINIALRRFLSLKTGVRRWLALVLSVLPVLLLIIQSITQLTLRDVLLTLAIILILVWYVSKSGSAA